MAGFYALAGLARKEAVVCGGKARLELILAGQYSKPAHAELVEARTECGACLDKLGMSGSVWMKSSLG